MADQTHLASLPARALMRVALFAAASLAGVPMLGCADTVTFSRSENAVAGTLLSEGEADEAAIIYANQVRRSPKDYRAHYNLGRAQAATGRTEEAIRSFRTALEVMPLTHSGQNDDQFRFFIVDELSSALAEHDSDGAQLTAIEGRSSGDKTLKLLVAMTYAKGGDPDNAIRTFNEAVLLDRDDPQIPKQFGLYLESIAQADYAQQQLRRAYRLNSQDEEVAAALRRLGIIPGPAILSATQLSKPTVPLGPLPEVKWEKQAQQQGADAGEGTAQQAPPRKTLN